MAEVVNLRRERKRRARGERETEAAANRARFGQPKALREAETANRTRSAQRLDAHRREPEAPDGKP